MKASEAKRKSKAIKTRKEAAERNRLATARSKAQKYAKSLVSRREEQLRKEIKKSVREGDQSASITMADWEGVTYLCGYLYDIFKKDGYTVDYSQNNYWDDGWHDNDWVFTVRW
jgi:hypothetical protein